MHYMQNDCVRNAMYACLSADGELVQRAARAHYVVTVSPPDLIPCETAADLLLALALGLHPRVGAASHVRDLHPDVLELIAHFAFDRTPGTRECVAQFLMLRAVFANIPVLAACPPPRSLHG